MREYRIGQKVRAIVREIRDQACWIDFGGVDNGMVHVSKVSDEFVDIHEFLHVGDEVDAWISEFKTDGKVECSLVERKVRYQGKQPMDWEPFRAADPKEWHVGKVKNIMSGLGAHVLVKIGKDSAEGFVGIAEISAGGFVDRVDDYLQVDDPVKVRIIKVQTDNRGITRMPLSMKELRERLVGAAVEPDALETFCALDPGTWLEGTVEEAFYYGARLRVTAPDNKTSAVGMLKLDDIPMRFVDFQPGQKVQVRVKLVKQEENEVFWTMRKVRKTDAKPRQRRLDDQGAEPLRDEPGDVGEEKEVEEEVNEEPEYRAWKSSKDTTGLDWPTRPRQEGKRRPQRRDQPARPPAEPRIPPAEGGGGWRPPGLDDVDAPRPRRGLGQAR